jgi:flavin reductase (DIM6/NTAB) family NADH-FMN oxidoreductase RutF
MENTLSIVPDELPPRDAYRLLISVVVPRPIAWVSTIGADGTPNLAPFSFFNAVGGVPPIIMFSVGQRRGTAKDTLRNVRETGEFVVNLVSQELGEAMNQTSGEWPYEVNEFELAGLATGPSVDVRPPRVAAAPVAMEARVTQIVPVEGTYSTMVLGQVLRYHIRDGLLRPNGLVNATLLRPLARLSGDEYATLGDVFAMPRPRA